MNKPTQFQKSEFRIAPSFILSAIALVLFKLWLVCAQPITALPYSVHDDQLFLKLANSISEGQWLGDYDNRTLAKGPGYPLFIAASLATGIPLPLTQHLLYAIAAAYLIWALRPWLPGDAWALLGFAILLWNPMSYDGPAVGRVLRQSLYTPLAMLCFGGFAGLLTRIHATKATRLHWAVLLGTALGWLWITREESIWIVPSGLLCFAAALFEAWKTKRSAWSITWPWSIAVGVALLPSLAVCTLNYSFYGWFGLAESKAPQFIAAYSAISRVKPSELIPMVPVPQSVRISIAKTCPTFAKLEPYLEGDIGLLWAGCSQSTIHQPIERREIGGGWWMWALRDAVTATGHAYTPTRAMNFYARLAQEVNSAFDQGLLPAGPKHHSLAPVWNPIYTSKAKEQWLPYLESFLTLSDFTIFPDPSTGNREELSLYRSIVPWTHTPSPAAPELDTAPFPFSAMRLKILQNIGMVLCLVQTSIVLTGFAAWILMLLISITRRQFPQPLCYVTAVWGGTLALLILNFIIHITSFNTCTPIYFVHIYVMVLLAALVSLGALFSEFLKSTKAPQEKTEYFSWSVIPILFGALWGIGVWPFFAKSSRPAVQKLNGHLDSVSTETVYGWAWNPSTPNVPIKVTVFEGDRRLGSTIATQFRPDLKNAGIGSGNHAFTFTLPDEVRQQPSRHIYVRTESGVKLE